MSGPFFSLPPDGEDKQGSLFSYWTFLCQDNNDMLTGEDFIHYRPIFRKFLLSNAILVVPYGRTCHEPSLHLCAVALYLEALKLCNE